MQNFNENMRKNPSQLQIQFITHDYPHPLNKTPEKKLTAWEMQEKLEKE